MTKQNRMASSIIDEVCIYVFHVLVHVYTHTHQRVNGAFFLLPLY